MPIGHLYALLGEVSIQVLCPFLNWVAVFYVVVWRFFKKLKMDLPFDPMLSLLGIYMKESKILIQKNISTICSLKHLQLPRYGSSPSVHQYGMDKSLIGHLHNGIPLGHKNNLPFVTVRMDLENICKWNKPVRERQLPYDFTYMWNWMKKLN